MGLTAFGAVIVLMLSRFAGLAPGGDELYGRVTTVDGEVVEGFVRWDRNEAAGADFLDGRKEIPAEHIREAERLDPEFAAAQREARSLVAFGMRITWDEDDQDDPRTVDAAIRFAHVASIVAVDRRTALVELSSGETVELTSASSDLGRGLREVVVTPRTGEARSFRWRDLDRVDFLPVPDGLEPPGGRRLHGTVTTWNDLEITGSIAWDLDEILTTDILDGRQEGEDYEIEFADIVEIEPEGRRSARVLLRSGETLELRGTNDVNRDNRGVEVSDLAFGRAVVPWEDLRLVRFHVAEGDPPAPDFSPGAPLVGTVYALDGRVVEGHVRWGNVQAQLWESLRGWIGDTRLTVELGSVTEIRKVDEDRLEVSLLDGRVLELDEVGDPDARHPGIFVTPEGRATRLVRWQDFERLEIGR
jgi:hypothetical protein